METRQHGCAGLRPIGRNIALALLLLAAPAGEAFAQRAAPIPPPRPSELSPAPSMTSPMTSEAPEAAEPAPAARPDPRPLAPSELSPGTRTEIGAIVRLTRDSPPLLTDVIWRIFGETPGSNGQLPLIAEFEGGNMRLALPPGNYLLHVSYGRAGVAKRITVGRRSHVEDIALNAGGVRLNAFVGTDNPLGSGQVSFEIYTEEGEEGGDRALVVPNAAPGRIIPLNAGIYYIVSRYGGSNAVVRAEITVEPGKVTEATVYHKAARVTLKLVSARGGEALANTAWSVVTPGGDTVVDSVGAFPTVILTAGEYTAVARHEGRLYEQTFTVEPDINRDVEVIAR